MVWGGAGLVIMKYFLLFWSYIVKMVQNQISFMFNILTFN